MDVGPQFQQQQLSGLGGEGARPIARVENPPAGPRSSSPGFTPGRRGEQLKMFMTPSEIHAGYQPLDADRYEHGRDTYIPRGSDRSTFTGGSGYRRTTGGSYAGYTHFGSKYKTVEEPESDEDLYARKLDEAKGYGDEDSYEPKLVGGRSSRWSGETYHPRETGSIHRHTGPAPEGKSRVVAETPGHSMAGVPGGYAGAHWTQGASKSSWESSQRYTPSEPGVTLHESIGEEGVQSPIRLGTAGGMGSMGKPQVVGGHHRLASATEHASYSNWGHQFLPVLHYTDIGAAKADKSFKYT